MGSLRVVFDTNVLISGIGFGGKPWQCLVEVFVGDVELLTSEAAIAEFERVLGYDHLPFSPAEQERFPELLRNESTVIDPGVSIEAVDDDPDDDVFLECAVDGDADYVVSGDPHLIDLGSFEGIPILTPAAFVERLEEIYRDR